MTKEPWVTWLLSTKNSMPYLEQTLHSMANQTYRSHKVLAWDDCSADGSLEELRRWIPSRIPGTIFAGIAKPLGPSLAVLVEQSDTELCARIDGDDINLPERLEKQVTYLSQHPETGIVGGQIQIIDRTGDVVDRWHYEANDAAIRWRSRWESRLCHPAVMFRKGLVLAAGNYRDTKSEDADLWQRLSLLTEFHNLPDILLQYRRTSTSSTAGLTDYLPFNRALARSNAAILFPGIIDPARALDLWEATHPFRLHSPSKFRHIGELKKAAALMAERCGKQANYFQSTDLYREQRFHLRRRFLDRAGLAPLLRWRDSFRPSANN